MAELPERPTNGDLAINREALFWSLDRCNIDKGKLREFYGIP